MPPYQSSEKCVKCGHVATPKYVDELVEIKGRGMAEYKTLLREPYILCTCWCGYAWKRAPLDAQ
jgi:hypothetical protein